jgi:hypothetical protein
MSALFVSIQILNAGCAGPINSPPGEIFDAGPVFANRSPSRIHFGVVDTKRANSKIRVAIESIGQQPFKLLSMASGSPLVEIRCLGVDVPAKKAKSQYDLELGIVSQNVEITGQTRPYVKGQHQLVCESI